MKRMFTAAFDDVRCRADIRLKDGSGAQCMRKRVNGRYCVQHTKIFDERFKCCGGNDDGRRPEHTQDCEGPK